MVSNFFTKPNISRRAERWIQTLTDSNISKLCLQPGGVKDLRDPLSRRPSAETTFMHVLNTNEGSQSTLKNIFGNNADNETFGPIYRRFDYGWSENRVMRKRIEYLKHSYRRDGWCLYHKNRLFIHR